MIEIVATMGRIKLEGYKCERCGHVWFPRKYDEKTEGLPILYPKCKSTYWNKPKGIQEIIMAADKKEPYYCGFLNI